MCWRNFESIAIMSSKWPCVGQSLIIQTCAVTLDDLRLDLADLVVDQRRHFAFAAEDRFAGLDHTVRAKRIRLCAGSQASASFSATISGSACPTISA